MTKRNDLLKNPLPRKILGLLLKKSMSQTDLAKTIYKNPNVRPGISKWIKKFLKAELIQERAINSKSVLYTANLDILGDFNKQEYKFIRLIIKRFWNPIINSSIVNLRDMLLQTLVIKKAYAIDKKLFGYNADKDIELYDKNKEHFWNDKRFRDDFLDKIKNRKRGLKHKSITFDRDYLFCCLIAQDSLFNKIEGNHLRRSNPLFTAMKILESLEN